VLVDILKQDWPHKWPSFIPDIVGASKTSEGLCENSMAILRLLSEEVFDFSKDSMTQVRGGWVSWVGGRGGAGR
jgi:exportin-1